MHKIQATAATNGKHERTESTSVKREAINARSVHAHVFFTFLAADVPRYSLISGENSGQQSEDDPSMPQTLNNEHNASSSNTV